MKKSVLDTFDWLLIIGTLVSTICFAVFGIGIGNAVSDYDWWITSIAAVLNIICVVLSAKGSSLNFVFGFIFNMMYTYYCIQTHHFGNAAVYGLVFLPMQVVGWLQWKKLGTTGDSDQVAAKRLTRKQAAIVAAASVIIVTASIFILNAIGGRDVLLDSVLMVLCVIAQVLLTFAFMEQWYLWIFINVLTITMWAVSAMGGDGKMTDYNLVITYIFTFVNSLNGLRVWMKLSSGERAKE
ncbi:MAG: nicotinamide riboside transporter PnuC [Bacteroidales bacterium]|nr:nicotinamide riboside transporter PnuC [Bacteroidales bacterium]